MRRWFVLALGIAAACGGTPRSPTTHAEGPAPARSGQLEVKREPLQIELAAARVGSSLRLDVKGIARGVREGEAFEDPERWQIDVRVAGQPLSRLVNGPVRIDRSPVGGPTGDQWDTIVRFSVVYGVPDAVESVDVTVSAPDAVPVKRAITL